jgi:hypothetical protein
MSARSYATGIIGGSIVGVLGLLGLFFIKRRTPDDIALFRGLAIGCCVHLAVVCYVLLVLYR